MCSVIVSLSKVFIKLKTYIRGGMEKFQVGVTEKIGSYVYRLIDLCKLQYRV